MPLYEFLCPACSHQFSLYRRMDESGNPAKCRCGSEARRILSAAAVRGDLPGYSCPVTGKWIEGRVAHENNLRRHGCHVLEKGEKEHAQQVRAREDSKLAEAMGETAARLVMEMPAEKQRQLGEELSRTSENSVYHRGA